MEAIWSVAGGVVAAVVTFWLGFEMGLKYRKMKRWQNGVVWVSGVLIGTVMCAVGVLYRYTWLWITGLAVMGGSLSGIRHGRKRVDDARKKAARVAARQVAADAAGETAQGGDA